MVSLILAVICSASMAVVLKIFQGHKGNRYAIILGNYLTCAALSALYLPEGMHKGPTGITFICGIIAGFLFAAGLVGMQSSIKANGAILTSAFSKLGLVVPLIISCIFLKEALKIQQIPGILLVLAAIWLICMEKGSKSSGSNSVLLVIVLLACGCADAMAKIFESAGQPDMDGWYFLILFITAILCTSFLALWEYRKSSRKMLMREFLAGIMVGISNYYSSYLLLQSLKTLPAFAVYPGFSIGTLMLITLVGIVFFREKPGKRKWIGLGMSAAALILLAV